MEFEPHRGVGPVSFGMSRREVREAMGEESRAKSPETDLYYGSSFQVSFGDGGVEFIELSSSIKEVVWFGNLDVFDTPADELLAATSCLDPPDPQLSRPPNLYTFPTLILTLWGRSAQYDHRGGRTRPVFAAVGLGTPAYLAAVRAIRG